MRIRIRTLLERPGPFHDGGALAALTALTLSVALMGVLPARPGTASPVVPRRTFSALALTVAPGSATVAPLHAEEPRPVPKRLAAAKVRRRGAPAASRGRRGGWTTALVSWYGPGFYGRTMAGGGTLRRDSMVVAHRSLPFGTRIMFEYKGRTCTAVVRDRGPYAGGRTFDLGPGTARALGFSGVGRVRYRILGR